MLWLEIPAYAGSTSPAPAGQGPAPDHPRIRGEHHLPPAIFGWGRGSSPHTRGAPRSAAPPSIGGRIIPAYAGSTACRPCRTASRPDHPRIRGEHADGGGQARHGEGSSPHTRGAPSVNSSDSAASRIIPAYAGSTSALRSSTRLLADHPRIRGEHDQPGLFEAFEAGSSPHTRGARVLAVDVDRGGRIIPAYAGSTPPTRSAP
mgnify:CR=1 FL=1